jgi:hypothetical protein
VRFVDEYRDGPAAQKLLHAIDALVTQPWTIMEVCGGQTHTLIRSGIDACCPSRWVGSRPRLPGVRDPARAHRQGSPSPAGPR